MTKKTTGCGPQSILKSFEARLAPSARRLISLPHALAAVMCGALFALAPAGGHAAQTLTGTPVPIQFRAVVNFKGLEQLEKFGRWTSAVPKVVHPPYPIPLFDGGGAGGGGGAEQVDPAEETTVALPIDEEMGSGGGVSLSPPPASSFRALDDNGLVIPPDTHGAVGPNHLMITHNTQVRIQNRSGVTLSTVSLDNFWSSVGFPDTFDPKVLYDSFANRWIFTAMGDARLPNSAVLIAVSQTADPTGNWFLFSIDADAANTSWADYPSIGFNKDWIVVTVNMFPNFGGGYTGANLYVFNKASLYANVNPIPPPTLFRENSGRGFTLVPAVTYDNTLSTMYLLEVDNIIGTFNGIAGPLRISTITGTVGAEVFNVGTAITANTNVWINREAGFGGSAPQLGSPSKINNNDSRIQNLVYRNGALWATHTVFLGAGTTNHSAVQWWQFAPDGTVLQQGLIDDPSGKTFYAFPSIAVNQREDVMIGYSRFSASQYASANYSFRFGTDPPNTLQRDVVLKAGEAPYFKDFFSGRNRWGDYSATVVDPVNDIDMWTIQEYAATPRNTWGTWWGRIDVLNTPEFRIEFSSDLYTVNEDAGTVDVEVLNIGGTASSVAYTTVDGTAVDGIDYEGRMGVLAFAPGQTSTNITITIYDNGVVNSNKTFSVVLSDAMGGAVLGFTTNATVEIIDDETIGQIGLVQAGEFNFSSYVDRGIPYTATENETFIFFCGRNLKTIFTPDRSADGAIITVVRTNGATGRVLVDYATEDGGTAIPFIDYIPVVGTFAFDDYQMSTNFLVEVFSDFIPNFSKFVRLVLSNPRPAPEEEFHRPGLIRPTLGLGAESGLFIFEVNHGISALGTNGPIAFSFERRYYRVDEYPSPNAVGGERRINVDVLLTPIGSGSVEVEVVNLVEGFILEAGSDYAEGTTRTLPNPIYRDSSLSTIVNESDYTAQTLTLSFNNQCRRTFTIVVTNDSAVEFNEDIIVFLNFINGNPPVNPFGSIANVTIVTDEQPAGAADREWNPANIASPGDQDFNRTPGANNTVTSLAIQDDGKTIIGGEFTSVNGQSRYRISRFNTNGSLDTSFIPGTGADSFVYALGLYPATSFNVGRILAAGGFESFNSFPRKGIVRLFPNGSVDTSFTPGAGANGAIRAMVIQPDDKIIIAGAFTEVSGATRVGVARLNVDGSLDSTFDPGLGASGDVLSIALLPSPVGNKIILGGDFLTFNDEFRRGVLVLNPDGSIDPTFDLGSGPDGSVYAIDVQTNGLILFAGDFITVNDRPRASIARVFPDGRLDDSWNSGRGANGPIYALTIQDDGKALIGGEFTDFNRTRRIGLARLRRDGTLDTSFLDTGYNQFAGLINNFSFETRNEVRAIAVETNGNVMIGGSFTNLGGNPSIRHALRNPYTVFTRADKVNRYNVARLIGGNTPGPGNAEFNQPNYFVDENGEVASIQLDRTDGRLGTLIAHATTMDRFATNGLDYVSTNFGNAWLENLVVFEPINVGRVSPIYFRVPLIDDMLQEGDETIDLKFVRPEGSVTLGGEFIPLGGALGIDMARLTIADNDFSPGVLNFSSDLYVTNENARFAIITVIRTNGASGPVSVDWFLTPGTNQPATPGADYRVRSGTLNFNAGQTNRTFSVELVDDALVEFDESITLVLTNASNGATLPGGLQTSFVTATLTIVDNDFPPGRIRFTREVYTTTEAAGTAIIAVSRTGGSVGFVSVEFATVDGTATAPADYFPTNGVLIWNDGESGDRTFVVRLRSDDLVEGLEAVQLVLGNPSQVGLLADRTNAVLNIVDSDAYGTLSFNQPFYQVDENAGSITVTVLRKDGTAGTVSVDYSTASGGARPGVDYVETSGRLIFGPGEFSKTFLIPILDDFPADRDLNQCLTLTLSNPTNAVLGVPSVVTLTIIDNESFNLDPGAFDTALVAALDANDAVHALVLEPPSNVLTNCSQNNVDSTNKILIAGDFTSVNNATRTRIARLNSDGSLDTTFDPEVGPNASVRAMVLQPNGKIIIGGFFDRYHATNRGSIARINEDGSLDNFFNPGAGADNPVYALALEPDGQVLVGGAFSTFNTLSRPGIVRLNTNGTVDVNFRPGAGANNTVFAVAVQSDGKIVIGGDFTQVNSIPRSRIARLNRDGALDLDFNPGTGLNAAARTLLIQTDGKIVVGGSFTNVNGVARQYLARLNSDGSLDTGFLGNGLLGADNAVFALAQQTDSRLLVGGDFRRFNGVTRNRLTRLNVDGTTDPTINFGNGANSFIAALGVQFDRKIIFGGGFTTYNDERHRSIARIYGGSVEDGGGLGFSEFLYTVNEDGTNALVTVVRTGGTRGEVSVAYRTSGGTAIPGVHYTPVSGTLTFPEGETRQSFVISILDNLSPNPDLTIRVELIPGTYTGGATNGPQPEATVLILNDEAIFGFALSTFTVNENAPGGTAVATVLRYGATNRTSTVGFATANGGTATIIGDYFPTNGTLVFLPGQTNKNFQVSIVNDTNIEGKETVFLILNNPSGSNVLGLATAVLDIFDNDFGSGQFVFSSGSYVVNEDVTNALITVVRTNGSTGVASVRFATASDTALSALDYGNTNGILTFSDNETIKTFEVPILNDIVVETTESLRLILSNPTGGATLGSLSNAVLTILDNDINLIIAAGSTLTAESIQPANMAVDPGETVTVQLALRNVGTASTGILLATLLPGNGVTSPSGPQSYGSLIANGPAITRSFSFTAIGTNGSRLLVTLLLTENGLTNGFATFAFTLSGQARSSFTNSTPITLLDNSPASPYPSTIDIVNIGGTLTKVTVAVLNLSHTYPDDIDLLLVSPTGQKVTLMSDTGAGNSLNNVTITFDAAATNDLPNTGVIMTGRYRPTNPSDLGTADVFPPPAPGVPYTNVNLNVLNGSSPNGTWSLYAVDDSGRDNGIIAGGWSITIEAADPVVAQADLGLVASASPNPVVVGNNTICIINVTNYGPSAAQNVVVTETLPSALAHLGTTTSAGSSSVLGGFFRWNVGTLPSGGGATARMTARADGVGSFTSVVTAGASQVDNHPIDNTVTMITTVLPVPELKLLKQGNGLVISWPSSASSLIVEWTASLSSPYWERVATPTVTINDRISVTITPLVGQKFFRLRQP